MPRNLVWMSPLKTLILAQLCILLVNALPKAYKAPEPWLPYPIPMRALPALPKLYNAPDSPTQTLQAQAAFHVGPAWAHLGMLLGRSQTALLKPHNLIDSPILTFIKPLTALPCFIRPVSDCDSPTKAYTRQLTSLLKPYKAPDSPTLAL